MKKVLVVDTSVLCVWLKVPGKETCGSSNALVTYDMVSKNLLGLHLRSKVTFGIQRI